MPYNWVYLTLSHVPDENYSTYLSITVELKSILSKKCISNKNDTSFYLEKCKRTKTKAAVDFATMNCHGNF